MKKERIQVLKILKIMLMMVMVTMPAAYAQKNINLPVEHLETRSSAVEKSVREAAVRVTIPWSGGHGSGSYIKYKDVYLVITAQHVASGALGTSYLVSHKEESHIAALIYSDAENDIAMLYVYTPFRSIEPMKFNPVEGTAGVGVDVFYSGYPSDHKLMSFVGRVAGHENKEGSTPGKEIILQTYGWFGCSGSVVYNLKGQQIGVLYGVDVEYYPNMQVQENMIWVAPMSRLKIESALAPFCRGYQGRPLKACR
jgi:S1-C subfamily serine protease